MVTLLFGIADADSPSTGVLTNHKIAGLSDAMTVGIDLGWEEHAATCRSRCAYCYCTHEQRTPGFEADECDCHRIGGSWIQSNSHVYVPTGEHDGCGPEERGDMLIGSWKKGADGKYEPDETGEYAAIVRELVTQVVWSKHTDRGAVASPCYPGQVDLETPGQYLAYTLPKGMFRDR